MTKHTSWAIALTATTFLSAPAIAASLTPTLEENSVFSYSEGSENDYNFTLQEPDADGKLTTKYYKIDLKPEAFSTSKNVSWTAVGEDQKDATDVVSVQLPNNQTKYFKYTYTQPEGYETITKPELVLPTVASDVIQQGGAAIRNPNGTDYGSIENKVFRDNKVSGKIIGRNYQVSKTYGGAVYNGGTIGNVGANFINNSITATAEGKSSANIYGGAISNVDTGIIGDITGNFIGNYAYGSHVSGSSASVNAYGGAVYNQGKIGDISGDFIDNHVNYGSGGAIYNEGGIRNIVGDFIKNYIDGHNHNGGAIYNSGTIEDITGDFIENYVTSWYTDGGAIYNTGNINNITGNFIRNHLTTAGTAAAANGGAIYNTGTIGNILGDFVSNSISADGVAAGAAILNGGTIDNIIGDFVGNHTDAYGGAIDNVYSGKISNITGNFVGNFVSSIGYAYGGAILNAGTIDSITGSFLNNHAESTSASYLAVGGAIRTTKDVTFAANGKKHFLSGNYTQDVTRGKIYNALFVEGEKKIASARLVTFDTTGGGTWVINDNIESGYEYDGKYNSMTYAGRYYNIVFKGYDTIDAATGTTTQYVAINNDIINARTVTVNGTTLRFGSYQHEDQTAKNWDGKGAFVAALNEDGTTNRDAAAVTSLSLNNGVFDIANGYLETVKLKGYSATDSFMHIDVDPDNMKADELHVAGNVEGVTKLIVHASSNADIRGKGEILFAQSENDTTGNEGSFVVSRVYKSPYLFDVKYDQIASNSNKWYFAMNDEENPDKYVEPEEPDVPDVPDVPAPELPDIPPVKPQPLPGSDRPVAPEVIGAESLPAAALAQNSNMVYNIMNKISANRLYCPGCGFYDYYWNGEAFHNLWANAVYNTLRIKTPTDIDADVWGIEAGGDLQHDLNNKLGLFLSYRKGNYDMNGDGKHHYSTIGSEIDIDSYLAGLYYRYDRNHWWTFATVYGGIQRVDLKTKDGIKSDTDGTEFGGSVELGYDYAINKTLYLTPSVGAFYTQVDYDDATDSAGKIAKYNTLRQLELEAGVKLTKAFVTDEGYANVYVKPSVVRTIADGDKVKITGLGKVNTLEDQTLGRVELGGRYGFTEQLSAYGWANHTFGDDYKASTVGLGLSYSW